MPGSALRAIGAAGLLAGTMDMTAAITQWTLRGIPWYRIPQAVASGLIGRDAAISGGMRTVVLGFVIHFTIATTWATVFYLASRRFPVMTQKWVASGVLYGIFVHLMMQFVVLPLSNFTIRPRTPGQFTIDTLIHIFCIGLPIAFMVRRYSGDAVRG
jgi:hypothetical protein